MERPKIKTALTAMLSAICMAVIVLSCLAVSNISELRGTTSDIGNYWMERLLVARDIKGEFANVRLSLARHMMATDKQSYDAEQATLAGYRDAVNRAIAKYETGVRTEKGRALISEVKPLINDYLVASKGFTDLIAAGDLPKATTYFKTELNSLADAANDKISGLVEYIMVAAQTRVTNAAADAATAFIMVLAFAAATSVLCLVGIVFAIKAIARPIQSITSSMRLLADGDDETGIPFKGRADEIGEMAAAVEVFRENSLSNKRLEQEAATQRDITEDERRRSAEIDRIRSEAMAAATTGLANGLKHLASGDLTFQLDNPFAADFESLRADFNAAVAQLSETLSAVANATHQIDSGTREISQSADDLSKRTEQQASSLEETAAALDQITTNVASSSKRAEEARAVAIEANTSAAASGQVVANAVEAMKKIEQSSSQISNIIGVIDEIAFQTNLLALNAGVEAARAGDAGKGFAVVAQEVRELAQRSAQAAKEIKELIRNSSIEVEGGVKLVRETGEALKSIETYVVTINSHMESIATSSREQALGLAEVNTAVNQMDQVTQQNAAMVEESTAASATLAGEATRLRDLIGQFRLETSVARKPSSRRVVTPVIVNGEHTATSSPVRKMAGKLARAFGGAAPAAQSWEDF